MPPERLSDLRKINRGADPLAGDQLRHLAERDMRRNPRCPQPVEDVDLARQACRRQVDVEELELIAGGVACRLHCLLVQRGVEMPWMSPLLRPRRGGRGQDRSRPASADTCRAGTLTGIRPWQERPARRRRRRRLPSEVAAPQLRPAVKTSDRQPRRRRRRMASDRATQASRRAPGRRRTGRPASRRGASLAFHPCCNAATPALKWRAVDAPDRSSPSGTSRAWTRRTASLLTSSVSFSAGATKSRSHRCSFAERSRGSELVVIPLEA